MEKGIVYLIILLVIVSLAFAESKASTQAPAQGTSPAAPQASPTNTVQSKCPAEAKCITLEKEMDLSRWCKSCKLVTDKYKVELNDKEGTLYYKNSKVKIDEFPEGTKFVATEKGIEVILPKKLDKLPKTGAFSINAEEEIELPDGNKLKGKVAVIEGQLKVGQGNSAAINNVEIKAEKNDVDITFGEPKKDLKNYVNFGKALTAHGDGFTARLMPGNKYANVEQNDLLMLSPQNGGTMTLTPRDKTVPELIVTGPAGAKEWGTLWNGQYKTTFGEKGIVKNSIENLFGKKMGSVPLEADVVDEKGNHLIKDKNGKPHKLLYDNDNRQFILPEDAKINTDGSFACPGGKGGQSDSERLTAVKERLAEAGRRASAK